MKSAPYQQIRQNTGVQDIIERVAVLKWNWAGHLARTQKELWMKGIMEWKPKHNSRSREQSPTRWTDELKKNG